MALETIEQDNALVIRVRGDFDFRLHRSFRNTYRDVTDTSRFVIDLSGTSYMDSSALGMLLLLREHAQAHGAKVELRGVAGEVARIIRIANFEQLFTISSEN